MQVRENRKPPKAFLIAIAVGAGWASGVYAGKLSVDSTIRADWIAAIGFGVLALLMAMMVYARRV